MISGLNTSASTAWKPFEQCFAKYLPQASFNVATLPDCWVHQTERMKAFILKTATEYNTGEDTILVGHSLGGVMACAMQVLMRDTCVLGITTIHSPNTYLGSIWPTILHAEHVLAPIISYEARHDEVLLWGSRHPKSMLHVKHDSNHFQHLLEREALSDEIVKTTVRTFVGAQMAAA